MNKKLNKTIDNYTRGLARLARLADAIQVPDDDFRIYINGYTGEARIEASCRAGTTEKVLSIAADHFGADGWTEETDADGRRNWIKTMSEVRIVIENVHSTGKYGPRAVSATEFPNPLKQVA